MSVGIRTSRIITVYDPFGYPVPKMVDIVEYRPQSRAQSPYKPDTNRLQKVNYDNPFASPDKLDIDIPLMENKNIFSRSIVLSQSNKKRRPLDQSVDDDEFRFERIRKAFKRSQQLIQKSDKDCLTRVFWELKNNVPRLDALKHDPKFVFERLELSEDILKRKYDMRAENVFGLVMLESTMINKKNCSNGLLLLNKQEEIKTGDPIDLRDSRFYQGLYKNHFGQTYKNEVFLHGFKKKFDQNWAENTITVNRDHNKWSGTRVLNMFNKQLIYYGLNRRLHGDLGPLENSSPNIVTNPVYRLFDIFLKRRFTGDDIKDLQFVISALLSKWISLEFIREIIVERQGIDDDDADVIIANLQILIDKQIFVPIDYSECLFIKYEPTTYKGYYKLIMGNTKKFNRPSCMCCGGCCTHKKKRNNPINRPQSALSARNTLGKQPASLTLTPSKDNGTTPTQATPDTLKRSRV
ncbi:UNKNOWN [Stylonychia lemnae]|uniref:Uncharacterized protein n=1 Tax=Stylonychia lemnae TaxID=5949 RepID=A0A078AVY8_STYLE|nr:UNKNOWN [Stylonychia lemnae]|eukprot:CDW86625.1 UNKNOWN [Stylonychia lemnae]